MNQKPTFCVLDESKILKEVFKHNNFYVVLHEFLSMIDNELEIMVKYKINVTLDQIKIKNLKIVEYIDILNIKNPIIKKIYEFDIKKMKLVNIKNNLEIDVNNVMKEKYTSIKNHVDILTKKHLQKSDIKNTQQTKQQILLNETNELIKNMDNDLIKIEKKNTDDEIQEINIKELEQSINKLKLLKDKEEIQLNELKEKNKTEVEKFSEYYDKLSDEKRKIRYEKEKAEEKRRIFNSDINVYKKIKHDIEIGRLKEDKIPELFINKYPIFKFMDENNLFDNEDEYMVYLNLYDGLYPPKKNDTTAKKTHVPHNINYLNEEEQTKYKNIKESHKDLIDELINKKDNKQTEKKYPGIDEIMKNVNIEKELLEAKFELEDN